MPFSFGLSQVAGQYRINTLRNGLLLTEDQFNTAYQQRVLYFYDLAERYLVPDVRYSALNDAVELSDWLLGQLVVGPAPRPAERGQHRHVAGRGPADLGQDHVGADDGADLPAAGS